MGGVEIHLIPECIHPKGEYPYWMTTSAMSMKCILAPSWQWTSYWEALLSKMAATREGSWECHSRSNVPWNFSLHSGSILAQTCGDIGCPNSRHYSPQSPISLLPNVDHYGPSFLANLRLRTCDAYQSLDFAVITHPQSSCLSPALIRGVTFPLFDCCICLLDLCFIDFTWSKTDLPYTQTNAPSKRSRHKLHM